MIFSKLDLAAIAFFLVAWVGYVLLVEGNRLGRRSLNGIMHEFRRRWMERMLARDVRIIDTQIMASLQNGSAFFASTSLLAVGGSLTLLRAADDVLRVFGDLPFGIETQRGLWEMKVIGLAVIFVYAFFKFAWSYRLFNYAAILLGATPPVEAADDPAALMHAHSVAGMTTAAGRHFNRGQRAFFFALGYLGWFWSPTVFILSTFAVLVVMALRQFRSDGMRAALSASDAGAT
ncbi:membrane protein [Alsobacter metallidurans]|uniref:Membrane protein n=1 Tax=Alsobacter metallidurans TaxID=340221 RepID=A0A917MI86_9HYPH|nr:DUF599 family protein [Alsobacter metallidurans]GGH25098.1 membrane protein [Alsobacter metallidurans]